MDRFTGITPEKHTKGFSYFEKNPTTEQIFKRRKLSEYSSTFQNNNAHTNYHYSNSNYNNNNNNNSSLHSSIDEYTYSMQNCDSSRSSSSNNNNNNYQPSLNFINTFSNQKQSDPIIQQFSAQKQKAQGEQKKNFSTSFQPSKKQNCISKSKTSLKDFLNSSSNAQALAQNLQNQDCNPNSYNEIPSKTSQTSINNTNLFDYNNYFFQQLLNQNNTQQGNSQNESQTERKSFDSLLQASFQNLSINECNQYQSQQSAQDSHFSQKRQSIITIPKAIKSQAPQYFQMNSKQDGITTAQIKQNQVITASSLNNIILIKSQQDKEKTRQGTEQMQNQSIIKNQIENNILYQHINEEIEEQSQQSEHSFREQGITEEQSLEQYLKKVEAKDFESKERNNFLLGDKQFQQSATRGRLSLGENCPLKTLKKQFPIIFPVGIPIMGQLSKLFNFEEQDQEQIKQNLQSISKPDSLQIQDELLDNQPQQFSSQMHILDQQDDPLFIGNLTKDERRQKVEKYLEKKKNRKWKSIRYNIRKNLADQRERIQGRFVKQKNSRFNFDLLDAQYLKQLTKECDKMRLIDMSHNTDNSFDIQNHSFDS
ncbi:hypothetical protein ABPG72_006894 [Tetrahymena utriculariae]